MRFAAFAVALVASFISSGYCQIDCALPNNNDFERVITDSLLNGDNVPPPTITISDFNIVCLAFSQQEDRYRSFSVLVEYTCDGFADCLPGTVVEQFEGHCNDDMTWGDGGFGLDDIRTPNTAADFSTTVREDCAICFTPEKAPDVGITSPIPDDDHHCVACSESCNAGAESPGLNRCYGLDATSCCRVYNNSMCDTECDDIIDLTTFDCLSVCPNDRGVPGNGSVSYSNNEEIVGGYRQGTEATVTCNPGFMGGGDIICQSNRDWSDELPSCQPEVIRDCGDPPSVDNAIIENEMNTWLDGSIAIYECVEGFFFSVDSDMSLECTGQWPNTDNIKCDKCENIFIGCKLCLEDEDGKTVCLDCDDEYEKNQDSCKKISGGSGGGNGICLVCIVVPIAVLLAIILAVIVAVALYAFYRWKNAPPTNLKEKDAEGINGVARDNPLYLDPTTVAEEVEE